MTRAGTKILDSGETFPTLSMDTVAHGRLTVPDHFGEGWGVFLLYSWGRPVDCEVAGPSRKQSGRVFYPSRLSAECNAKFADVDPLLTIDPPSIALLTVA